MDAQPEVVEQEATRPVPRWVWGTLAVVVLLGVVAWGVDERQRSRENAAIDDCRSRLHTVDTDAMARLMSMSDYLRPTLGSVSPEQARELGRMMQPRARTAVPQVQAVADSCRDLSVWSWHGAEQARVDATTAYAAGLLDHLERIAADGILYFRPDHRLDRLRARAGVS